MSPLAFIFALIGLATSAHTRWHGVPVLWLLAVITAAAMVGGVLILARQLVRDLHPAAAS